MSLKDEILQLKRKQAEVKEEQEKIKHELEKILFEKDFSYERIAVPGHGVYIYPCIVAEESFEICNKEIRMEERDIIATNYHLITVNPNFSIYVEETAFLDQENRDFVLNNIYGTIKSNIIRNVCYTVTIDGISFNFSKDIPADKILENNTETFRMELFANALLPVTTKNKQVENNFYAALNQFLYNGEEISFEDLVRSSQKMTKLNFASNLFCYLYIDSKIKKQTFSIELKCNKTVLEFTGSFQLVNYSARVFLKTLADNKKVMEFSGENYCIPRIEESDEIISVKDLFL